MLEIKPRREYGRQCHHLGTSVGDREHIDAEGILKTGFLIKDVFDPFRIRILFEFHENADAGCVRSVSDIRDLRKLLGFNKVSGILHELADPLSDHRIRDLGHDELILLASLCRRLIFKLSAKLQLAGPGLINTLQLRLVADNAAGRKIGPGHDLEHPVQAHILIVHIGNAEITELGKIMTGSGRGHTDLNAL